MSLEVISINSILVSIKTLLNIRDDDTAFDNELILYINSALSILTTLGVGPTDGFFITGSSETWDMFLASEHALDLVKSYVHLKVRIMFDPPTGSVLTAFQELIAEYEWRINAFSSEK